MAVIKIAGKQYVVKEGKSIVVPHLKMEVGEKIKLKDMLSDEELTFEVAEQKRGEKLVVLKFRNKTRYKRAMGHKSHLTVIKKVETGVPEVKEKTVAEKVEKKTDKKIEKAEKTEKKPVASKAKKVKKEAK